MVQKKKTSPHILKTVSMSTKKTSSRDQKQIICSTPSPIKSLFCGNPPDKKTTTRISSRKKQADRPTLSTPLTTFSKTAIASKNNKQTSKNAVVQQFLSQNKKGAFRVFVAGGSRAGNDPIYEEQAFELGLEIGKKKYRLDFGLSSKGIMGTVAKGVLKAWSTLENPCKKPIHGITTKEYLALYKSDEIIDKFSEVIVSHTLEERKQRLLGADFVIFAPGGVGTLDELVYDCVAMQDGFLNFKPFVLFNVDGFFYHLLEYLKEIQQKGFANTIPFIVVDDSFEAGVAFDLLDQFYTIQIKKNPKHAENTLKRLIYLLPYVIHQRYLHPSKSTKEILTLMDDVTQNGLPAEKKHLATDIKTAYLNKEIERMYERLAKAGRDTANVSDKLNSLKHIYKKGRS